MGTSSHDAPMMSCPVLMGKSVHAPGHLIRGSCSEWDARVATLVTPSLQREKWQTEANTVTLCPDT